MRKNRKNGGGKGRREKQLYYGLAILVSLCVIIWLNTVLHGDRDREASSDSVNKKPKMSVESSEDMKSGGDNKTSDKKIQNPNIRVLLMTSGYKNISHPEVTLSSADGIVQLEGSKEKDLGVDPVTIHPDDARFGQGNIRLRAKNGEVTVNSLKRGCGAPSYKGIIELRSTAEGIVIINELPVEEYLCRVVPSEMPASYELEALKAQAVCARSYAYRQMESFGYPEYEAHVNDSTDYQVYGNSKAAESASRAVEETAGQTVRHEHKIVTTYYYSTSGGQTTDMQAWGTQPSEENSYLKSVKVKGKKGDYEKQLPWYRWEAKVSAGTLANAVSFHTGTDIGALKSLEVTKRGPGDVAVELKATGDKGSVTVATENKIRRALSGDYEVTKQDGTKAACGKLLPSAFFTIERSGESYLIRGRGFGHGIGMSQNGANEMAKQGKDYKEILSLFYKDITIE